MKKEIKTKKILMPILLIFIIGFSGCIFNRDNSEDLKTDKETVEEESKQEVDIIMELLELYGYDKNLKRSNITLNDNSEGEALAGVYLNISNEYYFFSFEKIRDILLDELGEITKDEFLSYWNAAAQNTSWILVQNRGISCENFYNELNNGKLASESIEGDFSFGIGDESIDVKPNTSVQEYEAVDIFNSKVEASEKKYYSNILYFSLNDVETVNFEGSTISISLPEGMDINNLIANFRLSEGAEAKIGEISQVSGETANDFTGTVTYTIVSNLNETKNYEISVVADLNDIGEMHPQTGDFSPVARSDWGESTWNLGSFVNGEEATFAVYSKNATRVLFEIYDDNARVDAKYDYWMTKGADNIWRAKIKLPESFDHLIYGFRVWGPNWEWDENWTRGNSSAGFISDYDPNYGYRFNPNKVLFDPYGRELSHDQQNLYLLEDGENAGMYGTGGLNTGSTHVYSGPNTTGGEEIDRRNIDTGHYAPKSYLFSPSKVTVSNLVSGIRDLGISPQDLITMETHLRGFTNHSSSSNLEEIFATIKELQDFEEFANVVNVPSEYRGTYKGAAYMAPYLKALGYNAVEFLPIHETDNDANEAYQENLGTSETKPNFWGYMTLSFFAPDRRYAYDRSPGGPTREFKEMVKAFNDAGISVFIDVVYNHSGEGGNWGDPNVTGFTSLGGFDTPEYYTLTADIPEFDQSDKGYLEDGATGCGNQLTFEGGKDAARNLVKDSLKYWTEEMGVDGYRFDLAATLGRDPYNFSKQHDLLQWINQYGSDQGVKMVAEAWDIWGTENGNFPESWGEWNANYRDEIRKFTKGDANTNLFTQMVNGDYDWLGINKNEKPYYGVNFIVAHDGLTLADLVSYNVNSDAERDALNQQDWPFGPTDGGSGNNTSWNSEGTGMNAQNLRRQRKRNLWVTQFFSRGLTMSVYGDEFGRTQNGNNNPYCLDSIATWNNYNMINTDSPHQVEIGAEYGGGAYHNNFGTDSNPDGINNIFLFVRNIIQTRKEHATLRRTSYDTDYEFKKLDGISDLAGDDRAVWLRIKSDTDTDFLLFINMWTEELSFTIPTATAGKNWVRRIDTAHWAEGQANNFWTLEGATVVDASYGVKEWSIVVLQEVSE